MFAKFAFLLALVAETALTAVLPVTARGNQAANETSSVIRRQAPCYTDYGTCSTYCEQVSQQITGAPQTVGSDISCDTTSCGDQHSETFTAMQSFSINIGISGDSNQEAGDLKGGATAGATWSWSTSEATSDQFSFNLANGDTGHVVFRPYFQQSCGTFTVTEYYQTDDGTFSTCLDNTVGYDPNACGQTPIYNSNGFAQGEFTFCYTAGPNAGQGC